LRLGRSGIVLPHPYGGRGKRPITADQTRPPLSRNPPDQELVPQTPIRNPP
ncbi:unnamed protein product, partial [Gulo gulo]